MSMLKQIVALVVTAIFLSSCAGTGASVVRDTGEPVPDAVMGDWQGHVVLNDGTVMPVVAQIIAVADGKYVANAYLHFDERHSPLMTLQGNTEHGTVTFSGSSARYGACQGSVANGELTGTIHGSTNGTFGLRHIVRLSPTLGAKAPARALVLFNGTGLDQWEQADDVSGIVNLAQVFGGENRVAYLKTTVNAAQAQNAVLEVGSDDGVKIWLNGKVVHANNASRGITRGEDKVKIQLVRGANELLAKVTQGNAGWGLCARLVDAGGKPVQAGDIADAQGYLVRWSAAGPYTSAGKQAPEGLFDVVFAPETPGTDVKWIPVTVDSRAAGAQWTVRDGIMEVKPGTGSIVTKSKFKSYQMHIEFRTPFMRDEEGQARGNSGVYQLGRYEVQVLDSYGLKGEDNECGGIYKVAEPFVNMCAPPGQWQTYDITFLAPRFDGAGNKVDDARLTLMHNGVIIHDGLRIPGPTGGALDADEQHPGGILLQDHGNLVQYRNIWLVERKENQ